MGSILAIIMLANACFGVGPGLPNPVEDGRRLWDPAEAMIGFLSSPESTIPLAVFVRRENHPANPLTVWLDDALRHPSLQDHLDLFVPTPDHLNDNPTAPSDNSDVEALAPIVISEDSGRTE